MSIFLTWAALLSGAGASVGGGAAVPCADPPPASQTTPAADHEVALAWPGPVQISLEPGPYELVVRFDTPLAEAEIARFSAAAGKQLGDLRWNDNSLVLSPAAGYRVDAATACRMVRVRFLPETDPAAPSAPQPGAPAVELELARAQADAAAGYPAAARRRLAALARAHPADRQVQRALADAEAASGDILLAAQDYRALDADDPAARQVMAEAGGRAAATFLIRDGHTFGQWEAIAEAGVERRSGPGLSATLRHVHTRADSVAADSGYLGHIDTDATIASIGTSLALGGGSRLTAQVATWLDRPVTGAGARLYLGTAERQLRLLGAFRLPDLSTAEQAWHGGNLSRAGLGGTIRITPELVAQADAAWAGYGLGGGGARTETIQASGGVDYLLLRGVKTLQLSYRLDAEYVQETRLRANGIPFIPLSNRENHTLQLIFSMPVAKAQFTAAAGWTKDRFGGNGPTASAGIHARLGNAWRIDASGGISSISRQAVSGRQLYVQFTIARFLGR